LPLSDLVDASHLIEEDVYDILAPMAAVKRRNSEGGTGFDQVRIQIEKGKILL
jgi:argininosuccinate lyase